MKVTRGLMVCATVLAATSTQPVGAQDDGPAEPGTPRATTDSRWEAGLYEEMTVDTFRDHRPFNEMIDPTAVDYSLLHAAVFYVTNETRVSRGRSALAWAGPLEIAAYHHARLMAEQRFFSHRNPRTARRREPADRARLAGVNNPRIAENISSSFALQYRPGTPIRVVSEAEYRYVDMTGRMIPFHTYLSFAETVVEQWMDSPGHRRNMLSTNAVELGVGARMYRESDPAAFPKLAVVQKFQWYEPVEEGPREDPPVPGSPRRMPSPR